MAARVVLGLLLAANLAAAVVAFKPFGGSADDLRKEQSQLQDQLAAAQARLAISKKLVGKVNVASREGTDFLDRYVVDRRVASSTISEELNRMAKAAGVLLGQTGYSFQQIEGSDTLQMWTINVAVGGNYQSLMKFVNLVDKSSRFLIIESMQTAAPQQNSQVQPVQFKLDTFVRATAGSLDE